MYFFFGHYNINKGLTYKENQCLIYKPSARLCNWNCHTAKKSEKYNLFILNVLGECIFDKFILGFRDIIQHSGGQVVIWVCVASTAHGYFAVIEVTMNFCVGVSVCVCIYIYTLEINVRLSVWQPKFASCNTRLISSIAANLQKNGLCCCNGPALTDMLC